MADKTPDIAALRKKLVEAETRAAGSNAPYHARAVANARAALEAAKDELLGSGSAAASPAPTPTSTSGGDAPTGYRMETHLEAEIREGRPGAMPRLVPVGSSYEPQYSLEDDINIGAAFRAKFGTNLPGRIKERLKQHVILPFNSALKDGRDGDVSMINDRMWALTDKLAAVEHKIDTLQTKAYDKSRMLGIQTALEDRLKAIAAKIAAESEGNTAAANTHKKTIARLESIPAVKDILAIKKEIDAARKQKSAYSQAINSIQDTKYKHMSALNDRGVLQKGWGLGFLMSYLGFNHMAGGLVQTLTDRAPSTYYRKERRPLPLQPDETPSVQRADLRRRPKGQPPAEFEGLYGWKKGPGRVVKGAFQHFVIAPLRFGHLIHGPQRNGGAIPFFGKLAFTILPAMYFWAAWSQPLELARWKGWIGKDTLTWASFNHTAYPQIKYAFNPDDKVRDRQLVIETAANTHFSVVDFAGKKRAIPVNPDPEIQKKIEKERADAASELTHTPITWSGLEVVRIFQQVHAGKLGYEALDSEFGKILTQFHQRDSRQLKNASLRVGEPLSETQQTTLEELRHSDPETADAKFLETLPPTQKKLFREASPTLMDEGKDLLSRIKRIDNVENASRALFDAFLNPMLSSRDIFAAVMEHNFRKRLVEVQKAVAENGDVSAALIRAQGAASERDREVYLKDFKGEQKSTPLVPPLANGGSTRFHTKLFDAAGRGDIGALGACFSNSGIPTDVMHGAILRLEAGLKAAPRRASNPHALRVTRECGRT
jgi:hypothetical protein